MKQPLKARASRRREANKRMDRKYGRVVTPQMTDQVAALTAAGVPQTQIARAVGVDRGTVRSIRNRPDAQASIARFREAVRAIALEQLQRQQEKIWRWLRDVVADKNSMDFDRLTRGLHALERLASSASGEARRVEGTVTHEITADDREQAKELLRLLGEGVFVREEAS